MPVELRDLRLKLRRRVDVALAEDVTLVVWWAPDKYDTQYQRGISAMRDQAAEDNAAKELRQDPPDRDEIRDAAASVLVPLLVDWDLMEDGKPAPVTAETIASLGRFVVEKIVESIDRDATDYRALGKGSAGG